MTDGSGSNTDANTGGAEDTSMEGSTDTNNTGKNTTEINNRNYSTIESQGQIVNRNGQASIINPTVDTSNKAPKGAEPDIGCVLGLRFEKVNKKVAYNVFCKKFANYIGRNMKYGKNVVFSVKE